MRDSTDFYCCEKLQMFSEEEEFTVKELIEIFDWEYCPHCSFRLDSLI